ncbi:hypothetical protein HYT26_04590 [Candidatus Pacearchaeota archaeon]|nr:hypothetical protein [Candidatus Pacearchaeota archaeon]
MKHKTSITIILLGMFLITQLIGIFVISSYLPRQSMQIINGTEQNITITPQLPYGMQPPQVEPGFSLASIIISFIFAILLIFILTKVKAVIFIRIWFFIVVIFALGITINALFLKLNILSSEISPIWNFPLAWLIAALIALPLAIYKIFRRNIIIHNATELMIYPGIAAVFVPILNVWTILLLLILISLYDIYAVWHSKFMQNMAKFQINHLKLFTGFFVPYITKKQRAELKKQRFKEKRIKGRGKKMKINLAILGGGDVVFPMITAGVMLKTFSMPLGIISALIVIVFATLALLALFIFSKKGKFYPAMPFITAGCIAGMIIAFAIARFMWFV